MPGALPNAGTYQGSMEQQRRDQQQYQQQELQNQQMQSRLNDTYRQYAPRGGGGAGAGGPPPVNWFAKPPLPASRNPLLGRWRQVPARDASGNAVSTVLNSMMAGGCKSIFGTGVVAFEPNSLQWVAPDGHEEILNNVEYRSNGSDVVVVTRDPGAIPALFFGLPSHDHAVVALFGCRMDRLGARPTTPEAVAGPRAGPPASSVAVNAPPGPVTPGPANAVFDINIGLRGQGSFTPFGNLQLVVTPVDPAISFRNAGIVPPSGLISPADQIFADCHRAELCVRDWRALGVGARGVVRSDAAGHVQTPPVVAGRYYLLGIAPYQGKAFVWIYPVNAHPGANSVTLDESNARAFP